MTPPPENPESDSLCRYGAGYLLRQLAAMQTEMPGVRSRADIEHIHRMRVATRRFRSALPLFSPCLPERRVRRWRKELRKVARALGEARDADVQIAYLHEYLAWARKGGPGRFRETLPAEIRKSALPVPARPGVDRLLTLLSRVRFSLRRMGEWIGAHLGRKGDRASRPPLPGTGPDQRGGEADLVPGIEYLLLRHRQHRDLLQESIESAIADLEGDRTLGKIERRLAPLADGVTGLAYSPGEARAAAFTAISLRIDSLLSYGDALADPGRIREHHAMRIAGKRLRYTLEAWGDLYAGALADGIDTLKRLQDLLGELHDCDVWIGAIPEFVRGEEERSRAFFGEDRHFRSLLPGIRAVLADRRQERVRLHGACLTFWRDLMFRAYWEELRERALRPLLSPSPDGTWRVGLVAGIRGDADALASVLADGQARGADLFLNAGDTLGGGHNPGRAVELVRGKGVVSVIGDLDLGILEGSSGGKKGHDEPAPIPGISADARRYLASLPASVRLSVSGKTILLAHRSSPPTSIGGREPAGPRGVPPGTPPSPASIAIVSGHGDLPSIRSEGDTLFVNPGAVGRRGDRNLLPGYAILEIAPDGFMTATHHTIEDRDRHQGAGNSS